MLLKVKTSKKKKKRGENQGTIKKAKHVVTLLFFFCHFLNFFSQAQGADKVEVDKGIKLVYFFN